jgi:hypothetical protein
LASRLVVVAVPMELAAITVKLHYGGAGPGCGFAPVAAPIASGPPFTAAIA